MREHSMPRTFTLIHIIDNIPQLQHGPYHDRDDALRQANECWVVLSNRLPRGCALEFKLVDDVGVVQSHSTITEEIRQRPELREPPRMR